MISVLPAGTVNEGSALLSWAASSRSNLFETDRRRKRQPRALCWPSERSAPKSAFDYNDGDMFTPELCRFLFLKRELALEKHITGLPRNV